MSLEGSALKWLNVTFAHIPLVKASRMPKPNINELGKKTPLQWEVLQSHRTKADDVEF